MKKIQQKVELLLGFSSKEKTKEKNKAQKKTTTKKSKKTYGAIKSNQQTVKRSTENDSVVMFLVGVVLRYLETYNNLVMVLLVLSASPIWLTSMIWL